MQQTTDRHATDNMQQTTCNLTRAASSVQQTTGRHATDTVSAADSWQASRRRGTRYGIVVRSGTALRGGVPALPFRRLLHRELRREFLRRIAGEESPIARPPHDDGRKAAGLHGGMLRAASWFSSRLATLPERWMFRAASCLSSRLATLPERWPAARKRKAAGAGRKAGGASAVCRAWARSAAMYLRPQCCSTGRAFDRSVGAGHRHGYERQRGVAGPPRQPARGRRHARDGMRASGARAAASCAAGMYA